MKSYKLVLGEQCWFSYSIYDRFGKQSCNLDDDKKTNWSEHEEADIHNGYGPIIKKKTLTSRLCGIMFYDS